MSRSTELAGQVFSELIKNDGWLNYSKKIKCINEFRKDSNARDLLNNFASACGLDIIYGLQGILALPRSQGSLYGYIRNSELQQALGKNTSDRDCLNTKFLILLYFFIYTSDMDDDRVVISNFRQYVETELNDKHEKYSKNPDFSGIYNYYNQFGGDELGDDSKTKKTKGFFYEDIFKFLQKHELIEEKNESDEAVYRTAKMLELTATMEHGFLGKKFKEQLEDILSAEIKSN